MIKLVVDGFGGDRSPQVNVEGAVLALKEKKDLHIIITGDEEKINEELKKYEYDKERLEIVHAPDVISCNEKPTDAIRQKRDSSLAKAFTIVKCPLAYTCNTVTDCNRRKAVTTGKCIIAYSCNTVKDNI